MEVPQTLLKVVKSDIYMNIFLMVNFTFIFKKKGEVRLKCPRLHYSGISQFTNIVILQTL